MSCSSANSGLVSSVQPVLLLLSLLLPMMLKVGWVGVDCLSGLHWVDPASRLLSFPGSLSIFSFFSLSISSIRYTSLLAYSGLETVSFIHLALSGC